MEQKDIFVLALLPEPPVQKSKPFDTATKSRPLDEVEKEIRSMRMKRTQRGYTFVRHKTWFLNSRKKQGGKLKTS